MGVLPLIRQVVLGITMLFSLIELAVTAHLIAQTQQYYLLTATFCAFGLAVAAISVVTLPVMLIVDFLRRGAFTSMIVVEVAWLYILCIFWVASAGETISGLNYYFAFGCIYENTIVDGMCQETQAMAAFSFLNFIILLVYASVVLVMAATAATRGRDVWLSSVKDSFGSLAGPVEYPMAQHKLHNPASTV